MLYFKSLSIITSKDREHAGNTKQVIRVESGQRSRNKVGQLFSLIVLRDTCNKKQPREALKSTKTIVEAVQMRIPLHRGIFGSRRPCEGEHCK